MVDTKVSILGLGQDILRLISMQLNSTDASHEIQDSSPEHSRAVLQKFPKVYYQQRKTLPILRLVCRTFNQVVLPVRFRTFKLKLTDLESEVAKRVIEHVLKWTRCVVLYDAVDWALVEQVFCDENGVVLPRIVTTKWICDGLDRNGTITPMPSSLIRPDTRINFFAKSQIEDLIKFIPLSHLLHLNLGDWQTRLRPEVVLDAVTPVKACLLQAPNLKTFEYSVTGSELLVSGTNIRPFSTFKPGEKMPALEVLILTAYLWNHSAAEVESSWNFSRLKYLDIRGVPLYAFLSTVSFASFSKLEVLKVGDMAWSVKETFRSYGISLLEDFLASLPNLEELYMTGQSEALSLQALSHLPKLQILECREAVLLKDEEEKSLRFTTAQLAQLREYCPYIRELVIDMDVVSTEFPAYLTTLRTFPYLNVVTLHTRLQSWDPPLYSPLSDDFDMLAPPQRPKLRPVANYTKLEAASNNLVKSLFRKMTVYVGGWQEVTRQYGGLHVGEGNKQWDVERVFVWARGRMDRGGKMGRDYNGTI